MGGRAMLTPPWAAQCPPEVQNRAEGLRAGFQSSYSHKSQKDSSHPPSYLPSTTEPRTLGHGPPVQCTETKTHRSPALIQCSPNFST